MTYEKQAEKFKHYTPISSHVSHKHKSADTGLPDFGGHRLSDHKSHSARETRTAQSIHHHADKFHEGSLKRKLDTVETNEHETSGNVKESIIPQDNNIQLGSDLENQNYDNLDEHDIDSEGHYESEESEQHPNIDSMTHERDVSIGVLQNEIQNQRSENSKLRTSNKKLKKLYQKKCRELGTYHPKFTF